MCKYPGEIYLSQETDNRTSLLRYLFPLLFLFMITPADAQQKFSVFDSVYGADPLLVNGRYYSFFPPPNTKGNQYLEDHQFQSGTLTLRGKTWSGLMLNYDIYNQQLLMTYRNETGADNLIVISDAWLEKFSFNGRTFEILPLQDTGRRIIQIIGSGPIRIGYLWHRDLKPDSFHGARYYSFSSPKKEMMIISADQMIRYRNNRTFCAALDERKREVVREYLDKRRIRVRRTDDHTMADVMELINARIKI